MKSKNKVYAKLTKLSMKFSMKYFQKGIFSVINSKEVKRISFLLFVIIFFFH